jgi:MoxR-like ATPase
MKQDIFEKLYYTVDPVSSEIARTLRNKLMEVYTIVKAKAYFVTSDMLKIKTAAVDKKPIKLYHVPAAIIAAHLVNRSSTLLEGPPGCGKTKIIKIISRLMTGASITGADNIIYCDEELTKDKWMGFPDVAALMGNEHKFEIVWASWIKNDACIDLIIDEINRANRKTQNELLSFMAEGILQYATIAKSIKDDYRLFFTQNPLDDIAGGVGIYPLGFAFKDRITQFIPVAQAPAYAMKRVSEIRRDDLNYDVDEDKIITPIMTIHDIRNATVLASKIPVTEQAKKYAQYIVRDPNLCLKAHLNDKTHAKNTRVGEGLCNGCHFSQVTDYHCQKFIGGSMRMYNDLIALGRAYSFFLGIDEVNEFILNSIAMDVVNHRVLVIPKQLREDKKYGKNEWAFLRSYLVDWCFGLLTTRKVVEESFNRLYYGTGTMVEEDIQSIMMRAQNDLYVRVDLLPKVMEIDTPDGDNLKEGGVTVLAKASNPEYRKYAAMIRDIMNSSDPPSMKWDNLEKLAHDIPGKNIDFSGNLIDMIYAQFPVLQSKMERDRITNQVMEKRR